MVQNQGWSRGPEPHQRDLWNCELYLAGEVTLSLPPPPRPGSEITLLVPGRQAPSPPGQALHTLALWLDGEVGSEDHTAGTDRSKGAEVSSCRADLGKGQRLQRPPEADGVQL